MAATAEKFDYVRAPEAETYGRSLTTMHRVGAIAVESSIKQTITSPEAEQARAEFYTSVEEGFGTDMELGRGLEVRDFDTRPVINGKVMSKDNKTPVSEMTHAGVICGEKTAQTDKRFLPQLLRSHNDHKNALITDQMARGETDYNTRIVISPFPEEAAAQSGNQYWQNIGYVPHLRRGFVQVYHAGEEFIAGSLSFNGSDKVHLREVARQHDVEVPESETTDNWLNYSITGNYTAEEAKALATEIADAADKSDSREAANTVDVTNEHRSVMDTVFDDSYLPACESLVRGSQTSETRKLVFSLSDKAGHLNERYRTALYRMRADGNRFTDDDMTVIHELLVYSAIEMMRALHQKTEQLTVSTLSSHHAELAVFDPARSMNPERFQRALSAFIVEGAVNKRVYSACGLAISVGEAKDGIDESPQTAYGGTDSAEKCKFISKKCPECGARNVETTRTPEDIKGACGCKVKIKAGV